MRPRSSAAGPPRERLTPADITRSARWPRPFAGLVSRRKTGRTTYLILNPRRLRLLQDWAGQFHTYWGSDEASFENYHNYLGIDQDRQ